MVEHSNQQGWIARRDSSFMGSLQVCRCCRSVVAHRAMQVADSHPRPQGQVRADFLLIFADFGAFS